MKTFATTNSFTCFSPQYCELSKNRHMICILETNITYASSVSTMFQNCFKDF